MARYAAFARGIWIIVEITVIIAEVVSLVIEGESCFAVSVSKVPVRNSHPIYCQRPRSRNAINIEGPVHL